MFPFDRQVAPSSLAVCGQTTNAILVFSIRSRHIGSSLQPHVKIPLPESEECANELYILDFLTKCVSELNVIKNVSEHCNVCCLIQTRH